MATLPVDFLDDILNASMNGKRKYRITHADGSTEEVILEDVSEYDQVGSNFGAAQVNQTNEAVNEKLESADVVDPMVATEEGFAADAKLTGDALSELNKNLDFSGDYTAFGIWCIGNYGNCYLIVPLPIPSNVKANYNVNVTFVGLGGLTSKNLEMKDYSVSVYSGMLMINCAEALNTIKDTNFTHLGNVAFTVTKKS